MNGANERPQWSKLEKMKKKKKELHEQSEIVK